MTLYSLSLENIITKFYSDDQDPEIRSHLFTDRGIYRPDKPFILKVFSPTKVKPKEKWYQTSEFIEERCKL